MEFNATQLDGIVSRIRLYYTIQLEAPTIVLISNEMRIILKLSVNYPGYSDVMKLMPVLTIPIAVRELDSRIKMISKRFA
jgi:hypothetical protein